MYVIKTKNNKIKKFHSFKQALEEFISISGYITNRKLTYTLLKSIDCIIFDDYQLLYEKEC